MVPADMPAVTTMDDAGYTALQLPWAVAGELAEARAGVPAADLRFEAMAPVSAGVQRTFALDQIAAAAGVTSQALRYAFRRSLDVTPIGYLRRVRLERAHAELQRADPASGVTVAGVARRWGWSSPSRFTKAYWRRFGVLPGHTLRT